MSGYRPATAALAKRARCDEILSQAGFGGVRDGTGDGFRTIPGYGSHAPTPSSAVGHVGRPTNVHAAVARWCLLCVGTHKPGPPAELRRDDVGAAARSRTYRRNPSSCLCATMTGAV